MTYRMLLKEAAERLAAAGIEGAAYDARMLLLEAFGLDTAHLLLIQEDEVPDYTEEKVAAQPAFPQNKSCVEGEILRERSGSTPLFCFQKMVAQREARVPLQQILGRTGFCGLDFYVNSHVLTPRQDTEILVEQICQEDVQEDRKGMSVLDMCTGSGCIAISLAVLGGYGRVMAVDVSEEALAVAAKNARRHLPSLGTHISGASIEAASAENPQENPSGRLGEQAEAGQRFSLLRSDLFSAVSQEMQREGIQGFDLIVSNPPYIPSSVVDQLEPEVRLHEPRLALDGRADGLYFYRRLAKEAPAYLKKGGRLYLEIGYDQGGQVSRLLEEAGFKQIRVIQDLAGLDRVVRGEYDAG